ncbi:hypothetical protein [Actinacidiphila bryophytorum]|uniref:hypothetical protein n=1 Tax=Actinacidiphila bryophytorum TaxID=1436133 RepID=UPI00195F2804|nr:hypothetical protein [Actinacidiphila bryophytorum]MBM9436660.1 hypothetical protein [Actinacidiphila bryophytorum]MBN6546457.1 hypothetical protein [Actinacidiphila bryophytorum]
MEVVTVIFGSSVGVICTQDRAQAAHAMAAVLEAAGYPVHCQVLPSGPDTAEALPAAAGALARHRCDVLITLAAPPAALGALRHAARQADLTGWVHADPVGAADGGTLLTAAVEAGVRYEYAPAAPDDWRPVLLALGPHVARKESPS